MTQKEIATVCFAILGRHFPGEQNLTSEQLEEVKSKLNCFANSSPDLDSRTLEAAEWKASATKWLVDNISFKKGKNDNKHK